MEKDDFRKPHIRWPAALWLSWNIKNPDENTGVTLYVFHRIVDYVELEGIPRDQVQVLALRGANSGGRAVCPGALFGHFLNSVTRVL